MTAEEKKKLKRFARSLYITLSDVVRVGVEMYMKLYK